MIIRLKVLFVQFLTHPFIGYLVNLLGRGKVRAHGFIIITESDYITPTVRARLFWGLYERTEIRLIREHLRSDLDVVELGSSIGVVSCQIRQILNDECRLICVEANPFLVEIIEHNLKCNNLWHNTFIYNRAIDYTAQTKVAMNLDTENTRGRLASEYQSIGQQIKVPTIEVSHLLGQHAYDKFAMVCDIEGAEAQFILAGQAELQGCEQIIIEMHHATYQGQVYIPSKLCQHLVDHHQFKIVANHGNVWVLVRDT